MGKLFLKSLFNNVYIMTQKAGRVGSVVLIYVNVTQVRIDVTQYSCS